MQLANSKPSRHSAICDREVSSSPSWRTSIVGQCSKRLPAIVAVLATMLVTTGSANAQTGIDEELGRASLQDFSGGAALNGTYFDVRNQAGSGVGYRNGFTQFGMFTPFINDGDTMIGGQIRMLVTDTSRIGYNVGGVARRYFEGSDRIWGVNAYFDDDQSTSGYRYRQIAFGFESLGRYLDFRANGYVPTSNDNNVVGPIGLLNNPFFYGNRIAYTGLVRNEQSLAGGDFEFGVPVIPGQRWLRAYAGMYIYEKPTQGDAPVGVRARVEGWVSDDLSVGMMYTNDKQFGSNLNAVVDFRFSGYKATRYFPHYTVRERMLMPVQRNWRVATTEYNTTTKVDIYNPADLNPYFVTWVDSASTAAGPGTGTFEDPFKQLPANAPGSDLVLVRRGNSTQGNPYDGSITLDPNTRMLGEGIAHQFDGYAQFGAYQQGGTYTLPGFTNSGLAPYLTSTTGDVITIADNNEVRSFNIQNGFGSGITNNPATGVNNFLLRDLNLTANAAGINLRNAYGTGRIENVVANNNAGGGVVIDTGANGLTLNVNSLSSNAGIAGPQAYGLYLLADDGNLATTISGLSALGNGQGLRLETVGQVLTANVTSPTTSGGGDGVFVGAQGGVADVRITNIAANSNSGTGLTVIGVDGAAVRTQVTNGAISGNGVDAINTIALGGSIVDLIVDPINATGSGRHGFNYTVGTGAQLRADILDLDFSNSGVNGVNGNVDGIGSEAYVLLRNTSLAFAGQDAFNINVDNGGVSTVEMRGGSFFAATRNGLRANVDNAGVLNMFVTDSSGAFAGESGAVVTTNNSAVFNGNFLRSSFANSGFLGGLIGTGVRDAMNLSAFGNSVLSVNLNSTFTNDSVFGTQENGLAYNVASSGQLIFTNNDGDMRNNLRSAITGSVTDAISVARITMNNTSGADSGGTGFLADVTNGGNLITNISNGSFARSGRLVGGDGVAASLTNQGSATINFSNVNVDDAERNGLVVNATGNSGFSGNFTSSSFDNAGTAGNGGNGVLISATQSTAILGMLNTSATGADGDGMRIAAQPNSSVYASVVNGSFDGAGSGGNGDGVDLTALGNSLLSVNLSNTTADAVGPNLAQNGLRMNATNGGDMAVNVVNGSFSNNSQNGILSNVDGAGSNSQLVLQGTTVNGNGQRGANLTASNNANMNFVTTPGANSFFSNNLNGEGLLLQSTTGANFTTSLQSIQVVNNAGAGVRGIANAGGRLDLAMAGNSVGGDLSAVSSNRGGPGIDFVSDGPGSLGTLSLNDLSINNNAGHGIDLTQKNGGTIGATNITNNVIQDNLGRGINILVGAGAFGPANISGNTLSRNFDGIVAEFLSGATGGMNITGNTINQALDDGIRLSYKGGGGDINILGNTINSPANDGIQVDVGGAAVANLNISNNTVGLLPGTPGLSGDGVRVTTADTARLTSAIFNNNDINQAGLNGLNIQMRDQSRIDAIVALDNRIGGNGLNGFNLEAPVLPLNFQQVTLGGVFIGGVNAASRYSGNAGDGINIQLNDLAGAPGVIPNININNVDIDGNGSRGVNLVSNNSFLSEVNLIDVRVSNTLGQTGIRTAFNGGQLNQLVIAGGSVNGTANTTVLGTGIDVSLNNVLGVPNVTVANMTVNNNAGRGISIVSNSDVDNVLVSGNSVNNSAGGQGIFVSLLNNTANSVTARNNTVANSGSTGIDLLLTSVAGLQTVRVDNNSVDNSAAYGVSIWGINSPIGEIQANGNAITDSVADGLLVRLQDSNTDSVYVTGSGISSNDGNGVNFELVNSSLNTVIIDNNRQGEATNVGLLFLIDGNTFGQPFSITNQSLSPINLTGFTLNIAPSGNIWDTAEPGASIPFAPVGTTATTTGLTTVNGNPFPNALPTGGVPDDQGVLDLAFNDFNQGETFTWDIDSDPIGIPGGAVLGSDLIGSPITVNFAGGLSLNGSLVAVAGNPDASQFQATGGNLASPGISNNGLDGIRFSQTNSNIGDLNIQNSISSNNGSHGVEFLTSNSNLERVTIRDNTIDENAGDGVRLINPTTNSNSNIDMVFERNTITNSTGGNGINVTLNNAVGRTFRTTLDNNTISGNSLNGVNLELSQNAEATVTMAATGTPNPVSGTIGNNISNNGTSGAGMGIRVNANSNAIANLRIGAVGDNGVNTVAGNRDAGIGVNLRNNAALTAAVANITISGTVNGTGAGADPNFNGEGFAVRMTENATFNDSVIGTEPGSLRTTNFTGNASHGISVFADGSSAMNNLRVQNVNSSNNLGTGNGLDIVRAGGATLNNTLVQLSTFNGNNNGVSLSGSNAAFVDEYTLNNNTISNNRANGVALLQRFDAQLQVDMGRNTITGNGGDGVQLREQANASSDLRITTGTWSQNVITGNTGDGIDLQGMHNLTIGTGLATGNDISSNGQDGIRITGTGNISAFSTANISGNFIESNGANGIEVVATLNNVNITQNTVAGNTQTGVRLENQQGILNAAVSGNIIEQNGIDGVEILTSGTGVQSTIALTGNSIADNQGRGVDILTRVNALADITITNNDISRNRREGVYLVNTSSATQTQDSTSTVLAADGDLFSTPRTVFNMSGNTVFDNGFSSSFSGTGLAVRVGTSAGLNPLDFTDPGDFVSNNGGPGFTATTGRLTGAGGVLAAIDNNVFGGSAGSDVLFESFVSTGPVTTTTGTWDNQNDNPVNLANDVFTVGNFVADPLSRLDLRFTGNSGDSADVTRSGASYNNDESIFKSRTVGQNPPGPFNSGTRARNAQRLAGRGGAFANPTYTINGLSGNSDNFQYSGVGGSTFRRTAASNTGGFTNTDTFLDLVGLGGGQIGELPFNWATISN